MASFTDVQLKPGVDRIPLPATLREAVVEQLRTAIVSGDLAPGAQLKDSELARQLGLSATPVREALVQLAGEGLVEIKPNCLKRVAPVELHAMVELLEVQKELWRLGYQWGVSCIGEDELKQLRSAYHQHAEAIAYGDLTAAIAAALAFHKVVMVACGNRELLRVSIDRLALIQRFVRIYAPQLVSVDMLKQHRDMISALERGDGATTIAISEATAAALLDAARDLLKHERDA